MIFFYMKKLFTFFCLSVLSMVAFFASSLAANAQDEATATLKVFVFDDTDGFALGGATVTFGDYTVDSNAQGQAFFEGLPASVAEGTSTVTVSKEGYDTNTIEVTFDENLSAAKIVYLVRNSSYVAPEATYSIEVTAYTTNPYKAIADATVTFRDVKYYTNEQGKVTLSDLPLIEGAGDEELKIVKEGYEDYVDNINFEIYQTVTYRAVAAKMIPLSEVPDVPDDPVYSLNVMVTDPDFNPIEEATVVFKGTAYYTDEDGLLRLYDLTSVNDVEYVTVYKDGYEDVMEPVAFTAEKPNPWLYVTLYPVPVQTASLYVSVLSNERPVEGALVSFNGLAFQTDATGTAQFAIEDVASVEGKMVPFTVTKFGYETYEGMADFTETLDAFAVVELKAVENESYSLTVMVADPDGNPVEGANVTFKGEVYPTDAAGLVMLTDLTSVEMVEFVTVSKEGYEEYSEPVVFTSENPNPVVAVTLYPVPVQTASLFVQVISEDKPVEGALVVLFNGFVLETDATGSVQFVIEDVESVQGKKVPFAVTKAGYESWGGEADFTETLDAVELVVLEPAGSAVNSILKDAANGTVKVYDLNGNRVANPQAGKIYIIEGRKVLINQ